MGERDQIGELVERHRGHRERLVAREGAVFLEQRGLGDQEGVVHGRGD